MKHELEMIEERHEAEMLLLKAQIFELKGKAGFWGCLATAALLVGIALFIQI